MAITVFFSSLCLAPVTAIILVSVLSYYDPLLTVAMVTEHCYTREEVNSCWFSSVPVSYSGGLLLSTSSWSGKDIIVACFLE